MAHDPRHLVWAMAAAIVGGVVAFGVGIFVYALGSFLLMRAHTSPRPMGASARALAREVFLAALTQPLLPLYYVFGRRMGGAAGGVPIVLVHGYMQNRVGFLSLARALGRQGLGPLYAINYPWFASLADNARRLERFVARVCAETGAAEVDLVCHSMGGLVAMEMLRGEARRDDVKIRRIVTIATPHAGVVWRGPILGVGGAALRRGSKLLSAHAGVVVPVPCLSVFSSHDNIVHPKETSSLAKRGGRDLEVEGVAHLAILFLPRVAEEVARFLEEDL